MVSVKKPVYVFLEIVLLFISLFVLDSVSGFRNGCIAGTILILINFIIYLMYQKKVFTAVNIIFLAFILFQFGIPILYAIDPNYSNWYINRFNDVNLLSSLKYTIICIEFFSTGLILSDKKNKVNLNSSKNDKKGYLDDSNSSTIYFVAKVLFLFTGLVSFPLAIYVAYLASIHGYNYIKVDSMGIYNGVTRICQALIVPSILLLIIYAPNESIKKIYKVIAFIYAILLVFTGARTTSLALILVVVLMGNLDLNKKMKLKNKIFIIVAGFLLLFVGTFVAQYRFSGEVKEFSIIGTVESVVEEMGFNFTSLPFTKLFIPKSEGFKYGLSYLASIICLIPRSLDPTGLIDKLYNVLPELWLADNLHLKFGKLYDFGVGYSVIAESFFNFGKIGFITIFFQGFIIGKLLNIHENTKFKKYVKYIMLFSLITYPRRSFLTLLKSLEYCIFLIMIFIWLASYKKKSNR